MISFNKKSFGFVTLMLLGASAQAMDVGSLVSSALTMPEVPYLPRVIANAELPEINGNTLAALGLGLVTAQTLRRLYQTKTLALPKVGFSNHEVSTTVHVDPQDVSKDVTTKAQVIGLNLDDVKIPVLYMPAGSPGVVDLTLDTGVVHPAVTVRNAAYAVAGIKFAVLVAVYGSKLLASQK